MKPVAWYIENNYYDSLEEAQYFCDNKAQITERVTALYTAEQLRQAKAEVLREAAKFLAEYDEQNYPVVNWLNHKADEIERSKT